MAKNKMPPPMADINVTPMVDVMLVMLIIFMVITPMLSKGVSVDLVRTRNPIGMADAEKEDAVVVAVMRDGRYYLGTTPVQGSEIAPKVRDMLTNRLDKTTYIKADQRARYENVVTVVDELRSAGVDQVGLMTEQIDEKHAAAAGGQM
ncbi:MAG: ExbD/TolR family protein [bacterium]|jgi:biopolymer transport protein ExbD